MVMKKYGRSIATGLFQYILVLSPAKEASSIMANVIGTKTNVTAG